MSSAPQSPRKLAGRKKRDDPTIKRRSTRACDQCRKTKSKCELPLDGGSCRTCEQLEVECTLSGPSLRRGPPKGYLHAVESRLHEVESLLGILISLPDARATSLLSELSQDPFARDILVRVNNSPFGPAGREQTEVVDGSDQGYLASNSQAKKTEIDPYANGPTNAWQDKLINKFMSPGPDGTVFQAFGSSELLSGQPPTEGPMYPNRNHALSAITQNGDSELSSYDAYSDSDDGLNALGQLSIDDYDQVRFHGKSSGLPLLGQSERRDSKNKGGLWRLKDNHAESQLHLEDSDIEMPPLAVQEYLLELYFAYTYSSFPIVDREQLWTDFNALKSQSPSSSETRSISKLLLLSMFAVAARHTEQPPPNLNSEEAVTWTAGYKYFDQAKTLLNRTYHISHPVTCQALLLLANRELGMGAVAQAWLYVGMAIRMAQDLGIHRSGDNWQRGGVNLFTPHEKLIRKRIWYGCVKKDKYISMYMGRPVTIHEKDFDTMIPDDMNDQEFELWKPHPSHPEVGYYTPVPGRFISCCNANSALSLIVCRVIERLYAVRNDNSITAHWTEAMALKQQLDIWRQELPHHLQISNTHDMLKVPPHILTLHMQWECAVILIYRRFIRISKKTSAMDGPSLSSRSLESSLPAAARVHALANAYRTNFTLKHATAFDAYDIFYAGAVWVACLTVHPFDERSRQLLDDCIGWLKEMEVVWPCASRCYHLLNGAKVAQPSVPVTDRNQPHQLQPNGSSSTVIADGMYAQDDIEFDPSSYASQLLFADVVGGPVDSSLFNGYMWNTAYNQLPPMGHYAPQNDAFRLNGWSSSRTDEAFDYPSFGELPLSAASTDRSTSGEPSNSASSSSPYYGNMI